MKAFIEIKESNVKIANLYNENQYGGLGVYLNTNEEGIKDYLFVNNRLVLHLGNYSQCKDIFETNTKIDTIKPELLEQPEPLEEIEQVVSESFALKMVALVLNKEKFNDLL